MLAELRRQLTEEDAALTNLRARLESDLQRRRRPTGGRDASASESPASRYDVYATSDGSARQRFDDVFRFFSQGRGAVTPETFQAAAKELGLDLNTALAKSVFNVDPEVYSAVELAGVDLSQQPSSIGIENFVRWWHFSTKPAAVLTRSAWTRRQTEQAAANRGGYRDPHRDADPEWSPVKKLRASVSVGHVEGMEAKSSIHIVALPSNQQNFTDVVDELRDKTANPDGDDEADTLTAEQLVAVASLRLPVNPNVEDEHVQECLELFRAAAEEFNAQNEFPVATRIGLVNSTKGYGKDFVIAVFTRTTALNEELPFVKFFAVLELLQEVGSPVGTQPFFEQISLGIDFGTSAADVLKLGGGAPLAQLTRTARLAFAASLTDEIIDAVHQHIVALAPKAQIQHAGTFLPRAVKGLNAELHFDTAEDVLDASLDVLEDLALRERVVALGLGATEAKIVEAQQKVRQIRHNFRGALTSEIQFDVKVADAFGASKVARLFGADREVVAPLSIYGSSNLDLAWFVHCLEFPAADQLTQPEAAVVDDKLGKTGPFQFQLPGKLDDGSVRTLPVVALTFADAVQAVTSNGLLVALVNVTSNATLVRDLGELQRATATKAGPMVIVAYSAPDRFATGASPDLDKLQALCEEALPSRNVLQVFQWRCGQSLDRVRTCFVENCEVQEEGNDDDQGEGSSMKEIIKTILYAFRKVTTGPSEVSVVTHDAEVTAKLIGIPLFNVLPASKAEANAAVAAARHSVRSQRYFKHAVFSSSNNNDMVPRDATPAGRDSSSSSDGSDAEVSGDDRKVRANRTPSDDDSASNGADESD